jgi:hypothetical protein
MRRGRERHDVCGAVDRDMSEVLRVGIDQAYLNGIALAALELCLALF